MSVNQFRINGCTGDQHATSILDLGWMTLRNLESQLLKAEDPASAAAIRSAMSATADVMVTVHRLTAQPERGAERLHLHARTSEIERCSTQALLPLVARHDLAGFFCSLLELQLIYDGVPRYDGALTASEVTPATRATTALPLKIPSGLLSQARRMLLPAERMAIGAVRRGAEGSVLEAVFDVTGTATPTHVDAEPTKLVRTFIDIDSAGAVYAFWAHTQPGAGALATMPSTEDRDTFQRRLRDGDSRAMIAAIFSESHVRFLRANSNLDLVDAGDQVQIIGDGVRLDLKSGCGDVYEFAA